jgi:hypothetical protein
MPLINYTEFTNIIKLDKFQDKYVSLNEDGTLYIWNYGDTTPTVFITNVSDFQCNGGNIIIFKTGNTIWIMGNNEHGILNTGDELPISTLQQFIVPPIAHIVRYQLDKYNLFIYDKDDNVWGTGYNNPVARLWPDIEEESIKTFTKIGKFSSISCGNYHVVVQTPEGRVLTKGINVKNNLGLNVEPNTVINNFEYTNLLVPSSSKPTAKFSIDFLDLVPEDKIEMQYGQTVVSTLSTTKTSVLNDDFKDLTNWDITSANGLYISDGNNLVVNNSNIADSNYYIQTTNLYSLPFRFRTAFKLTPGIANSKYILEFLDSTGTLIDSINLTFEKDSTGSTSKIFDRYIYDPLPTETIILDAYIYSGYQLFYMYNEDGSLIHKITTKKVITSNIKFKLKIIASNYSMIYYMNLNKLFVDELSDNLRIRNNFMYKVQKDSNNNIKIDWGRFNLNDVNFHVINMESMVKVDFNVDRKKEAIKVLDDSTNTYYYIELAPATIKPHTDILEEVVESTPEMVAVSQINLLQPYDVNRYKIGDYIEYYRYDRPIVLEYDSTTRELKVKQWRFPGKLVLLKTISNIGINDKIIVGNNETTVEQFWLEYSKAEGYVKLPNRNQTSVPLTIKRIDQTKSNLSGRIIVDFD